MRHWLFACVWGGSWLLVAGCGSEDAALTDAQDGAAARRSANKSGQVDELVGRAKKALRGGNHRVAVELLSQAIGNDSDNALAFVLRADAYVRTKQFANALADFSSAIRIEPENARWLNSRGYFLLTRGRRRDAIKDFDAAIVLKGDYAEAHNNRGLAHVGGQDYEQAIKDFNAAIAARNMFADAWNNRGFAHFRSGDYQTAIQDFNKAIECNPDFAMAYNNRALLRMDRKEYRQAVADCTEAIKRDGDNPRYYHFRRQAYRKLGRAEEALADGQRLTWLLKLRQLNQQIAEAPAHSSSYIRRAEHFNKDGRGAAALADYDRAIRADPGKSATAYLGRATYWFNQQQYARTIEDCTLAEKAGAEHGAWSLRGEAWMKQGDFARAIADFVRARRFDVVVAEAYWKRSEQLQKAGQAKEAAAARARAIDLDPRRYGKQP